MSYPEIVRALLLSPSTALTFASKSRRWLVELAALAELRIAPPAGLVISTAAPPAAQDGLLIGRTGRLDASRFGGALDVVGAPAAGTVVVLSSRPFLRPPAGGGGAGPPAAAMLVAPLVGPARVHPGTSYWWIDTAVAADHYYRAFRQS